MSGGNQQELKFKWANTAKNIFGFINFIHLYIPLTIIEYGKIPNSNHVRSKRSKNG
jgi:hypothetical protein